MGVGGFFYVCVWLVCVVGFWCSERYVKDPTELYSVGQVVKCVIRSVDPESKRMSASFKVWY